MPIRETDLVSIIGSPTQSVVTMEELKEFTNDGISAGGVTIEEVNEAIDTKIESKADADNVVISVAGRKGTVSLSKSDVGLNNVDNTSDANKPVSTAQKSALDLKIELPSSANEGDLLVYRSGKWVAESPSTPPIE